MKKDSEPADTQQFRKKPLTETIQIVDNEMVLPEQQRQLFRLGFAKMLCKGEDSMYLSEMMGAAYTKNRLLFSHGIQRKFNIFIAYSKLEFDRMLGRIAHKDVLSSANGNAIILYYQRVADLIPNKNRRKTYLTKLLTHETNHVFYSQKTDSHKPKWLCEGLANYLSDYYVSENCVRKLKRARPHLCYKLYKSKFNQQIEHLYPMSYLAVKYLVEKENQGMKKLLNVIDEFSKNPTKERFNAAFLLEFGFPVRELRDKALDNF